MIRLATALKPEPRSSLLVLLQGPRAERERALESASCRGQWGVTEDDYELLVVESASPDALGREHATSYGRNVVYVAFDARDADAGPMTALDTAFAESRGALIGVVDGALVVTPRLVERAVQASRLAREPLVVVPTYDVAVHEAVAPDDRGQTKWRTDPYSLFEGSTFSDMNPRGYLSGLLHAECFVCSRGAFARARAGTAGTAQSADDVYGAMYGWTSPARNRLIVLGGEGAFRQSPRARVPLPAQGVVSEGDRQPLVFGTMRGPAQKQLSVSLERLGAREARQRKLGQSEWAEGCASLPEPRDPAESTATPAPKISIVVVAFRIPRQMENTLYSLSAAYQENVREEDYEIIVVENRSSEVLGEARARSFGSNVRYVLRDEPGVSPAPAMNVGIRMARASTIGLMVDGARLVTPRVIEHALLALRIHSRPLVVVPGHGLGPGFQHVTALHGYGETTEQALLASIDWKRNGYRLFEIGTLDEATKNGALSPMLEATCLFCPRACLDEVGGVDERFDTPGGGIVNLDLFDRLCRLPDTRYVVLWGEGSFHQFHGGTSTGGGAEDRERRLESFRKQYETLRGHPFEGYEREPLLLGVVAGCSHERLEETASFGAIRYGITVDEGRPEWLHD